MDATVELGRNPVSKHPIQPECGDEQADAGRDMSNPSRKTKFSGTNADREIFIFPVQLTTCRTGNLTQLIHTIAICVTIRTYCQESAGTEPINLNVVRNECCLVGRSPWTNLCGGTLVVRFDITEPLGFVQNA